MAIINPPSYLQNRTDHTAQGDRLALAGLVASSGLLTPNDLQVTAQAVPDMSVLIGAGGCYIVTSNPDRGAYHCYNDGPVTRTVQPSSDTQARRDIVVARVYDSFYSPSATDGWDVEVIAGEPAASPVAPAVPDEALLLATIDVGVSATSITSANIIPNVVLAEAKDWATGAIAYVEGVSHDGGSVNFSGGVANSVLLTPAVTTTLTNQRILAIGTLRSYSSVTTDITIELVRDGAGIGQTRVIRILATDQMFPTCIWLVSATYVNGTHTWKMKSYTSSSGTCEISDSTLMIMSVR